MSLQCSQSSDADAFLSPSGERSYDVAPPGAQMMYNGNDSGRMPIQGHYAPAPPQPLLWKDPTKIQIPFLLIASF